MNVSHVNVIHQGKHELEIHQGKHELAIHWDISPGKMYVSHINVFHR